jgi:molybdopterin synthase sulfur carrier subunit
MIRIVLPPPLRALSGTGVEVMLAVETPVTLDAVIDALEARYPMLTGMIRDPSTRQRRPRVRIFACQQDFSHQPASSRLPAQIEAGEEPLLIVAAISGG